MTEQEAMEIIMQVAYDGEFPLNSNEAFGIACKCIEKQIPLLVHNDGMRIPFSYYCPICREEVSDDGYKDCDIRYCPNCGQAIKWE